MLGIHTYYWSISELKWDIFKILTLCRFSPELFSLRGKGDQGLESVPVFKKVMQAVIIGTQLAAHCVADVFTEGPTSCHFGPLLLVRKWQDTFLFSEMPSSLVSVNIFRRSTGLVIKFGGLYCTFLSHFLC